MGDLYLRENLGPCKLVDLVGEVVGCRIRLNGELQLGHDFLTHGNLQSHVADGLRVGEPALYLGDLEPILLAYDELLDLVHGQDDVLDLKEHALPSDHVAHLEGDFFHLFEFFVDGFFVLFALVLNGFFDSVLWALLHFLLLAKQHLFLDTDHGLSVWTVRIELEANLGLNGQVETRLPDKLFKITSVPFGY